MEITIISIDSTSKYLKKIQELGRKNSRTLGFMPDGGFRGAADKGWILVAIDSRKECVGYLMYRVSTSNFKATIVQLCTDEKWRGRGIARKL